MGQDIKIIPYRFNFVEKTIGEVGAGTMWPMLVTLDQVAEIEYRIRDSKLTGAMTETYTDESDPPAESTLVFGFSGDPGASLVESSGTDPEWFSRRAFSAKDVTNFEGHFSATYTIGGSLDPDGYYDAIGELSMWSFPVGVEFKTGLSQFLTADNEYDPIDPPSNYACYLDLGGIFPAQASVVFDGSVAWVDDNASGDFFDPLNRKFIGVRLEATSSAYITTSFTTVDGGGYLRGTDFEIELAGDILSCPLYSTSYGPGFSYSGNIRLVATKWWPYDDGNGNPVWDVDTGLKI